VVVWRWNGEQGAGSTEDGDAHGGEAAASGYTLQAAARRYVPDISSSTLLSLSSLTSSLSISERSGGRTGGSRSLPARLRLHGFC
jgi:hypothetical protein